MCDDPRNDLADQLSQELAEARDGWNEAVAELAALRAERDAHLAMATDMLRDCDALRARVAALETTIERHNEGCEEACEWRKSHGHCTGYVERNMRCIDCPSDNVIELPVPSAGGG